MKTNVGVHNRFDFVITEKGKEKKSFRLGDRGEYEAEGTSVVTAHNVVLNRMWTRLCAGSTFGGYVLLGTGTGTPSASDEGLFTLKIGRQWILDTKYKGFDVDGETPLGYWRGYIEILDTEENGTVFTEVGVGYGVNNNRAVTHAMLTDAEGTPITIEKENTMVLKVYATIYSTVSAIDSNTILEHPSTNSVLEYLTGGSAPGFWYYLSSGRGNVNFQKYSATAMNEPCLSTYKAMTASADEPNRRRVGSAIEFGRSEGLINAINSVSFYGFGFVNKNKYDNAAFNGSPILNQEIGVGDGVNKVFKIPSNNAEALTPYHYKITVSGMSGYATSDVVQVVSGGITFTLTSLDLNFAQVRYSPAFGDAPINFSNIAGTGGSGSGILVSCETVGAPYSSSHGTLTVHKNMAPFWASDKHKLNLSDISSSLYYSKSNLIRQEDGSLKTYLYKDTTTITRVEGNKKWSVNKGASTNVKGLAEYDVCFSADGFGTDDGYIFDFGNGKMLVCAFEDDSFELSADINALDIMYDINPTETIKKAYVYSDRNFLLASDHYVSLYTQTSRNEFSQEWEHKMHESVVSRTDTNATEHFIADGDVYSVADYKVPAGAWKSTATDGKGRFVSVSGGGNVYGYYPSQSYIIGHYNEDTGLVNWERVASGMPHSTVWSTVMYSAEHDFFVAASYDKACAIGRYNPATKKIDWSDGGEMAVAGNCAKIIYIKEHGVFFALKGAYGATWDYKTNPKTNKACIGKYNVASDQIEWVSTTLPVDSDSTPRSVVYDKNSDVIVIITAQKAGLSSSPSYFGNVVVGKYDSLTEVVTWSLKSNPPVAGVCTGMSYNSKEDIYLLTEGITNKYAEGTASNFFVTGKYDPISEDFNWVRSELPVTAVWQPPLLDEDNGIYLLFDAGGNTLLTGALDGPSQTISWTQQENLPGTAPMTQGVYDSVREIFVIPKGWIGDHAGTSGINTNEVLTGRYNPNQNAMSWKTIEISCKNTVSGLANPLGEDFDRNAFIDTGTLRFVRTKNTALITNATTATFKATYSGNDIVAMKRLSEGNGMYLTPVPELDILVSARNNQHEYNNIGARQQIGADKNTHVHYYSDCILKNPHHLMSLETCIPDANLFVEFATAPPEGEKVLLSYISNGLNKINSNAEYYTIPASAYIQFGVI